jgi:hypothetical protein
LNFPLKLIPSSHLPEIEKQMTNLSSVFFPQFEDSLDPCAKILKKAAQAVRFHDYTFVGYMTNVTTLSVFESRLLSVEYNEDWSIESVTVFATATLFCLLPPFTSRVLDHFSKKWKFIPLVFVLREMHDSILKIVAMSEPWCPFFVMFPTGTLTGYYLHEHHLRLFYSVSHLPMSIAL